MKKIVILGSTGSIGTQAIEVCKKCGITVIGLSAKKNYKLLASQARELNAKYVNIYDENLFLPLKNELSDTDIVVTAGEQALCELAATSSIDVLLNSVVGMVGLKPTVAAIKAGTDVALANKETLVAGGSLVMSLAAQHGVKIFPVDSEHSAIFQCLQGKQGSADIKKIILTGSGGPFFGKTLEQLKKVTVSEALNHPNWEMGNKITIDSATLMNKGLEFIEAVWLFDVKVDQVEVVIHRESVIHSAVEFYDSSVIAQLGVPDMKIPIQYALTYPDRFECDVKRLNLIDYGKLSFYSPDLKTFSCLDAAIKAITAGGLAPAFINGVNEKAVELFLARKIGFTRIGELVSEAATLKHASNYDNISQVYDADASAREFVLSKTK